MQSGLRHLLSGVSSARNRSLAGGHACCIARQCRSFNRVAERLLAPGCHRGRLHSRRASNSDAVGSDGSGSTSSSGVTSTSLYTIGPASSATVSPTQGLHTSAATAASNDGPSSSKASTAGGGSSSGSGIARLPSVTMPLQQFEVSLEEVLHHRYLTLYNRRVKFSAPGHEPSQAHEVMFDVIGHPQSDFQFAVTFPFHPFKDGRKGGEVTVIREYAQGPNCLMYCLPTGGFDPRKHTDLQACAKAELSEEALLTGGRWVPLLAPDHPGLAEVKWCMNRFRPFLVVDPHGDDNPGTRDLEEVSMEVLRMPLEEFQKLMLGGDMLLPSITTGYMAMDKLRAEGLL